MSVQEPLHDGVAHLQVSGGTMTRILYGQVYAQMHKYARQTILVGSTATCNLYHPQTWSPTGYVYYELEEVHKLGSAYYTVEIKPLKTVSASF